MQAVLFRGSRVAYRGDLCVGAVGAAWVSWPSAVRVMPAPGAGLNVGTGVILQCR